VGHNRWREGIAPVVEVAPGEEIEIQTRDAFDGQIPVGPEPGPRIDWSGICRGRGASRSVYRAQKCRHRGRNDAPGSRAATLFSGRNSIMGWEEMQLSRPENAAIAFPVGLSGADYSFGGSSRGSKTPITTTVHRFFPTGTDRMARRTSLDRPFYRREKPQKPRRWRPLPPPVQ